MSLDALRGQIDAIDDQLLGLVERRLALSRQVAGLKRLESPGVLALRPQREEEILDRLRRRGAAVPDALVETVWRELLGFSLQAQAPTRLWIEAKEGADLVGPARRRFGSAARIEAATRDQALRAALAGRDIAIVRAVAGVELEPSLPEQLVVIDLLRCEVGHVVGAAVGRIPDEPAPTAAASGATR